MLPDGGEPGPTADGRTVWWAYNGADGPRAVGVRGACRCGWRGVESHPVDFGDDEATEAVEQPTGPYADWEQHVELAEGVIPRDVEQLLATLERRVGELAATRSATALRVVAQIERTAGATADAAVGAGLRNLLSWEGIGRALGSGPEQARERFGHLAPEGDLR
ncbi:hypothetical protein [Kitasatospora viridis]|uniref:hypothetical protein n=1 Tax=Kitasatospora viridis TaxID=281105 RepID=UPI00119F2950